MGGGRLGRAWEGWSDVVVVVGFLWVVVGPFVLFLCSRWGAQW